MQFVPLWQGMMTACLPPVFAGCTSLSFWWQTVHLLGRHRRYCFWNEFLPAQQNCAGKFLGKVRSMFSQYDQSSTKDRGLPSELRPPNQAAQVELPAGSRFRWLLWVRSMHWIETGMMVLIWAVIAWIAWVSWS
jgi:hypothetical protein